MVVKGRSKRKIRPITYFILHKIGLIPVIQIDFSPFCSSVLFDFTQHWPQKLPDEPLKSLDILSLMIWIPYKTNMLTWLTLLSSKGSSSWLSWILSYQGIPLFRRACKTPRCTKTHLKGLRLGSRSYYHKTYFVALLLMILKLSLHFLQNFWLGSKIKFTEWTIWSEYLYNTVFVYASIPIIPTFSM